MIDLDDMDDAEFADFCLELAVKQGRIKKTGTLARTEPDGPYAEDVIYSVVLN